MVVFAVVFTLFPADKGAAEQASGVPAWLQSHWFTPLGPQGKPPETFSDIEASLMPEDCGTCHERQYEGWKMSRHAGAISAGVLGQLHGPWLSPDLIISCQNCHAPLYEQQRYVNAGGTVVENRIYSEKLRAKGVSCAGCHVRKYVHYGPTPKSKEWSEDDDEVPHGGFKVISDFGRSEFCKPCHQFRPGDRSLNGKLFENTYEEWKKSPFAEKGVTCAGCHMPDREHAFQGIHSPRMVNNGMTISLSVEPDSIEIHITNSKTGHKLPTYVTPKIAITGVAIDDLGNVLEKTRQERAIQWMVSLDLSTEYFDTRLDPGETFNAHFDIPQEYVGGEYEVEVRVYPDEFYRRFFEAILANPPDGVDLDLIEKAHADAKTSDFSIYKNRFPIMAKLE